MTNAGVAPLEGVPMPIAFTQEEIGFDQCPVHKEPLEAKDGRRTEMSSALGTVYDVTDGKAAPVCDYAGYAPFGFGDRRCPGELFTIEVFKDFLRKVWREELEFKLIDNPSPEKIPSVREQRSTTISCSLGREPIPRPSILAALGKCAAVT